MIEIWAPTSVQVRNDWIINATARERVCRSYAHASFEQKRRPDRAKWTSRENCMNLMASPSSRTVGTFPKLMLLTIRDEFHPNPRSERLHRTAAYRSLLGRHPPHRDIWDAPFSQLVASRSRAGHAQTVARH